MRIEKGLDMFGMVSGINAFNMEYLHIYQNSERVENEEEYSIGMAEALLIEGNGKNILDNLLRKGNKTFRDIDSKGLWEAYELAVIKKSFQKNKPEEMRGRGILLNSITVDEELRNMGIGKLFIENIMEIYKNAGYKWIFLNPTPLNSEEVPEEEKGQVKKRLINYYTNVLGFEYYDHVHIKEDILKEFNNDFEIEELLEEYTGFCYRRLG